MEAIKNTVSNLVGTSTDAAGKGTVLVTGASGFLATHVVKNFLDHGYHVRGTVRSEETANRVRQTHSQHSDRLSFAIVEDVAAPGAFDEAVKGVDGVIHTASPFVTTVEDVEKDLLQPAIQGTTNILEAIAKYNPNVKRVVITSSFASIIDMTKGTRPGHTYTEEDWNNMTYQQAKESGNGTVGYCASKALAEKAAWDFVKERKPNFSLATVCPPMVYGPILHHVPSLDKLNTSSADVYRLMNGSLKEVPPTTFYAWADVRDVAEAHRLAYEKPEAAGQRFFITGGNFVYQQFCDIIRKNVPEVRDRTPVGKPGTGVGDDVYRVNGSKAERVLGLKYTSMEQCVTDTARSLLELEKSTGKA
ncbi:dihydroflavonol-4-reductase [Capronia coronata CBS 617.96]|uniref:Dihydroflavonol-4-reductase n=1 Tax=Capronia coronata CBS 617.96 TaxID=1182541 RepID=W9YHZ2_9EURO|nr:dihydroflavonol-4-reductase [Capronia coronata CBS 617.96]EXJ81899.1 dihydroflavonol-4-reductase [Capronia coronata CBS 617.96]